MRIGISAEFIGAVSCGMATYTQNLLHGLAELETGHRFFPYLSVPDGLARMPTAGHVVLRLVRPYNAWVRMPLTLPAELLRRPVDLFHATPGWAPPWCPAPIVATIHDIAFETASPQTYTVAMRWRLRWLVRSTVRRALRLICPSQATARDLERLYHVPADKIRVIHNPLERSMAPVTNQLEVERVRSRYGLSGPYILYLGMVEPKKNVDRLMHAYTSLRRERGIPHRLVLAGRAGWMSGPILDLAARLAPDVRVLGEVPQADVPALYTAADAFAFLSTAEGFGYPPLEAMACGCPVLAGQGGSLPEILGDAAVLVDPQQPARVDEGLARLLDDKDLRARLRSRGLERARAFGLAATASRVLSVYEECFEEIGRARRTAAEPPVRRSGRDRIQAEKEQV
jgi:glycosyltransferase involved in cell wall biosynthesis